MSCNSSSLIEMEWRQQTSVSCVDAFDETRRWIEEVTTKSFGSGTFRAALENGVLLCDLINKLKPGIIKRLNRLSTPIAGLDNVNVFLKACSKLGLNESQLFHPGDLQDLSTRATLRREESNRRLKNVLITVYWLGRWAQMNPFYCGPQLNFKAFEGLLGLPLSRALEEGRGLCPRDGGYGEAEKENLCVAKPAYRREDSEDSLDGLEQRAARHRSEGCCSDVEADQVFSMSAQEDLAQQKERSHVPPVEGACVSPALHRRKRGREDNGQGFTSSLNRSRSTSDIPIESMGCEELEISGDPQVCRPSRPPNGTRSKESEEKWQEDLTKWKNRRRSTNSDLHRKFQEREQEVNEMSNETRATVGQIKMPNSSISPAPLSSALLGHQLSPSTPGPTFSSRPSQAFRPALRPHFCAVLTRSHTVETLLRDPGPASPCSSCSPVQNQVPPSGAMPTSQHPLLGEEGPAASLASDGTSSSTATTPSACSPYTSQTHIKLQPGPAPLPPTAGPTQTGGRLRRTTMGPIPYLAAGTADRGPNPPQVTDRKVTSLHHGLFPQGRDVSQQNHCSLIPAGTGAWEEVGGLGSGPMHHSSLYRYNATPLSGLSSLPRGYRRSEGSARLPSVLTARPFGTRPSRMSSLPRISTGSDYKPLPQSGDKCHSLQPTLNRQVATSVIRAPHHASEKQEVTDGAENGHEGEEEEEEEEKEEEEEEEGRHMSGLPSCTPLCHTLPPPARPSPTAPPKHMRVSLSLKPNSVDDFGFQADWSATGARVTSVQRGSPAELCQLCVGDVINTLGGTKVEHMSSSQWESAMASALRAGSLTMDVSRYSSQGCPERHAHKDIVTMPTVPDLSAQGAIQTRNREFEGTQRMARSKGGTESAISDLQVPALNQSASNWSRDHEEERKRQERWQEEQERHLQESCQRDQQRLWAEWQRAQEAMGEEPRATEERPGWPGNPASHWEAQGGSVRHQNNTGTVRVQNTEPAPVGAQSADLSDCRLVGTDTGSKPCSLKLEDKQDESDLPMGSGFTQFYSAYRAKSKSTPTLDSLHRQTKGPAEQRKAKVATDSKAEQDRQQILEEMKKRTQLLTDNSWIRQRSATFLKEPLATGAPIRRYESLDSLHVPSSSEPPLELAGGPRPRSAAGFSAPGRTIFPRYTTCSTLADQPTSYVTSSQLLFPDAIGLSGKTGSMCAVANISEESPHQSRFKAETASLSANVATSSSSFPVTDLVM